MSVTQDLQKLFKDDDFVSNYRLGEKVTGPFALELINQSGVANSSRKPLVILDNACGTGIISSFLHRLVDDDTKSTWKLTCGDLSEGMLGYTKERMQEEGWLNAEVQVVDAQDTGLPSAHYTHVFAGFAFMAMPNPKAALDECFRILQPGGTIAFSTWHKTGWVSPTKDALESLPESVPFPSNDEFLTALKNGHWNSESWVEAQLKQHGFEEIQVRVVPNTVSVKVQDFFTMVKMMVPVATKQLWTEEQRERSESHILPALLRALEDRYGVDGFVSTEWIAVVATGYKPV